MISRWHHFWGIKVSIKIGLRFNWLSWSLIDIVSTLFMNNVIFWRTFEDIYKSILFYYTFSIWIHLYLIDSFKRFNNASMGIFFLHVASEAITHSCHSEGISTVVPSNIIFMQVCSNKSHYIYNLGY